MRKFVFLFVFFSLSVVAGDKRSGGADNKLDIVFCLDLSGSTNGLIADVRSQLWHIINAAYQLQPRPALRIGIVGFSRPSFKKENAYVKVLADFTDDFDLLFYELNKIRPSVEKGDQFVGAALKTCISKMSWSEPGAVKIIYMTGNGMAGTSSSEYVSACSEAAEQGIMVNALYVEGGNKGKEYFGWKRMATITGGYSGEITIGNKETMVDESTDMKRLFDAARELNFTYIYYGPGGYNRYMLFRCADSAAYANGTAAFMERCYYKNTRLKGKCAAWDLVDYYVQNGTLPDLTRMYMPDSLQDRPDQYIYTLASQLKDTRNRAMSEVTNQIPASYRVDLFKKYLNGSIPENNIFSRCVIGMMIKCWREGRTSAQER